MYYSEWKIRRFQQILNPETEKINMRRENKLAQAFVSKYLPANILYFQAISVQIFSSSCFVS